MTDKAKCFMCERELPEPKADEWEIRFCETCIKRYDPLSQSEPKADRAYQNLKDRGRI